MATKAKTEWEAWGGFIDGELDRMNVDDGYTGGWGKGFHQKPAIFMTRRDARLRFTDVRPVTITLAKPEKRKR